MLKEALRQHLLRTCPEQELRRWFDPLDLEVIEPVQICSVGFPHIYFAAWFDDSVKELFEKQIGQFMGPGYVLHYHCKSVSGNGNPAPALEDATRHIDFPYGHRFTFDTFFTNEKNYFPLALAKEVAKGKAERYNPFLICGPSGTGKTHLLKAMANEAARLRDRKAIFLGTVDDILNLYAAKFSDNHREARKYLLAFDWLCIDDFLSIRGSAFLEQEITYLFNSFYDSGKQMVFTCSRRFSDCGFLDATLKSRLEWGLLVHLKDPDLDVRSRYVEDKSRRERLNLTKDQVLTLAKRFESFRRLEGVLLHIEAFKKHLKRDLAEADFKRLLRLSEDKRAANLVPEQILAVSAEHFGLTVKDLIGGSRKKEHVFARQAAMTLCRTLLGMSYPALGKLFGGKDHSTVLYSIRKFKRLQDDNEDTKNLVLLLTTKCRQPGPA